MLRCQPLPALAALFAALHVGCASAPPTTPTEVVKAWSAAVASGDRAAAAALETPGAGAITAPRAAETEPVELHREAIWRGGGRDLVIAGTSTDMRLHAGVLGLSRATTPDEALALLGRALRTRDHALLLELLPASERPRWDADRLGARLAAAPAWAELGQALEADPVVTEAIDPGRAHATVGGTTIVLSREDEGWKVVDLSPRQPYAPALAPAESMSDPAGAGTPDPEAP